MNDKTTKPVVPEVSDATPVVENISTQKGTLEPKKHISTVFAPLATTTAISPCGKSEAKITFMVNGTKMTAYIRASRGGFLLQMPFSKAEKALGGFIDDKSFFSHDTSKQRVYKFATPQMLMEVAQEALAQVSTPK